MRHKFLWYLCSTKFTQSASSYHDVKWGSRVESSSILSIRFALRAHMRKYLFEMLIVCKKNLGHANWERKIKTETKNTYTYRKVDEWMHYTKLNMRRVWAKKSWFLPLLEYIKIFDRSANGQSIAVVLSILSVWKLHSTFIRTGFIHNFVALASASLKQFFRFLSFHCKLIFNDFCLKSLTEIYSID